MNVDVIESDTEKMDVEASLTSDNNTKDEAHTSVREENEAEDGKINDFVGKTCRHTIGVNGTPCSCLFTRELVARTRMNCQDMTKAELDLVVLANLEANRKPGHDELRTHINYSLCGHRVCKKTFLFVHAVESKHYKNLVTHFSESGLIPRRHGNTKRLPSNTVLLTVTLGIVEFILNYATIHGFHQPGRVPGIYNEEKMLLLPSHMTKQCVYREYRQCTDNPVSRRKFESL